MVLFKYLYVLGLLSILMVGCYRCPDLVSEVEVGGQDIHPYKGLLRNFSSMDVSIPSQDSGATLILPAGGQMDYTVWKPNFDIFGYVGGTQVYYKNITIGPSTKYNFFGKTYDFLAEVCPELPGPVIMPRQCPMPPIVCLPEPEPAPKAKPKRKKRKKVICPPPPECPPPPVSPPPTESPAPPVAPAPRGELSS